MGRIGVTRPGSLGQDVMIIATRLGGLVLVSIGVTILTDGLGKLLPGHMG